MKTYLTKKPLFFLAAFAFSTLRVGFIEPFGWFHSVKKLNGYSDLINDEGLRVD